MGERASRIPKRLWEAGRGRRDRRSTRDFSDSQGGRSTSVTALRFPFRRRSSKEIRAEDRERSKVLGTKRDADAFDAEIRRRKRTGKLATMDAGKETLANFAEE
jgi:hypothetical protein